MHGKSDPENTNFSVGEKGNTEIISGTKKVTAETTKNVDNLMENQSLAVIASRQIKDSAGNDITLTLYNTGKGEKNRYIISNGSTQKVMYSEHQKLFIEKILKEGIISNKGVTNIYEFYLDRGGFYQGENYVSIKSLMSLLKDFGLELTYDGVRFSIEQGSSNYEIQEFSLTNDMGQCVTLYLQDKGLECNMGKRFSLGTKKSNLQSIGINSLHSINFLKTLLSGKILANNKFEEYQISESSRSKTNIINKLKGILQPFGLTIINIPGIGYKIQNQADIGGDTVRQKTISTKLQKQGVSLYLEENSKGKDKVIVIEAGDFKESLTLPIEIYKVFAEAVKSFGGKFGWKTGRQEKGEIVEKLNTLFVSKNIPLWINVLYSDVVTRQGSKRVKNGEYELKTK